MAMYSTHYTSYDKDGRVISSGTFTTTSPYSGISYDSNGGYTRYSSSLISSDPPAPPSSGTPNNSNTTPSPGSSGGSGYSGSGYVPPAPKNRPPVISGEDADLGDKNKAFEYEYTIDDADSAEVRVDISVNQTVIKSIQNVQKKTTLKVEVTLDVLRECPLNEKSHIVITATDNKGAKAYRNIDFTRVNGAPHITLETSFSNPDAVDSEFTVRYVAHDDEGDAMTGQVLIDGKGFDPVQLTDGEQQSYAISHLDFIKLTPGKHSISVRVIDDKGKVASKTVQFSRVVPRIRLSIDPTLSTSVMAKKIKAALLWFPGGSQATAKVEACNNVNASSPQWEDITTKVNTKEFYQFLNTTAQGATALGVRITIESNGEPKETQFLGFSGSFE